MTTITIDRALLEQTLQALVRTYHYGGVIAADAECITALRAALAQQAEPVQEPVAWVLDGTSVVEFDRQTYHDGPEWTPLYTAPPQRKPLTEQEIDRIRADCVFTPHEYRDRAYGWALHFARAIERAHDITGDPK